MCLCYVVLAEQMKNLWGELGESNQADSCGSTAEKTNKFSDFRSQVCTCSLCKDVECVRNISSLHKIEVNSDDAQQFSQLCSVEDVVVSIALLNTNDDGNTDSPTTPIRHSERCT